MRKKNILLIVFSSLVLLSLILQTPTGTQLNLQIIRPVKANPNSIWVPDNYTTIQEAINNANEGETIFVRANKTYYEHVVINKTVSLVGENPFATIIDGSGTGIVVRSNSPNVEIRGFTIRNGGISPDSGVIIGSCIGNTVRDNIIRNNAYGITLIGSNGCSIIDNMIMNNSVAGIQFKDSSNNDIYENTIAYNSMSVWITSPSSLLNTFYCNNFIDNVNPPQNFGLNTAWDNGTEGNYWSDYTGIDTDGDGVGNTPYVAGLVTDSRPLIIPTRPFPVVVDDVIYLVGMLSNVTISSFSFKQANKTIFFKVTGPPGAVGFCNVTVPKDLINFLLDDWEVKVDGASPTYFPTPTDNATHTFIYFEFIITGTPPLEVVILPELPVVLIMPLFILTLVATVLRKSKKETSGS